ncbi:hypothetical protein [Paramicrobacterium fandaimingii]|uniref:hypothetical protein n=1 Tax=Paramicrobacterium fandaimingii TaxID=2708079 RepID=UPI00141F4D66|nr:hypothetical protein [Microbacterium fandaimingii]
MTTSIHSRLLITALSLSTILGLAACAPADTAAAPPAEPTSNPVSVVSDESTVVHFDLASGQLPENITDGADGGVLLSFAASRQIARVSPEGETTIIATLPTSKDASASTPVLGFPLSTGLVRDGEVIYALLATGAPDTTGVWKIDGDAAPEMIAKLPSTGLPNGLALDAQSQTLYIADSVGGVIFTVPTSGGEATVWSDGDELNSTGFLGVNGVKLKDGALYASNLDQGTVLRIPVRDDGSAGDSHVVARDVVGIDDFDFTGNGDEIVATINPESEVVLIQADGTHAVVLSDDQGLSNPTSALVMDGTLYVPSAAYVTQEDPNLIITSINF